MERKKYCTKILENYECDVIKIQDGAGHLGNLKVKIGDIHIQFYCTLKFYFYLLLKKLKFGLNLH